MNFLMKLSVGQKILFIPIIGAVSFALFIIINSVVSTQNASKLRIAQNIDFPALQLSTSALTNMEKVRDTLASSVTTGDTEAISAASNKADAVREDLRAIVSIDPALNAEVNPILKAFNTYQELAIPLTSSVLDNTADFATLGEQLEVMNTRYEDAIEQLNKFERSR